MAAATKPRLLHLYRIFARSSASDNAKYLYISSTAPRRPPSGSRFVHGDVGASAGPSVGNIVRPKLLANETTDPLTNTMRIRAEQTSAAKELPDDSNHPFVPARKVYRAMATVARERLAVEGWGDAEYAYLRQLALALHEDRIDFDDLVWTPEKGATPEVEATALAVRAFIPHDRARAVASGDEDQEIWMWDDRVYLDTFLGLDNPENPFAHRKDVDK